MSGLRRLSAEMMPIGIPIRAATTALDMTSTSVCGNMRPMYSLTG